MIWPEPTFFEALALGCAIIGGEIAAFAMLVRFPWLGLVALAAVEVWGLGCYFRRVLAANPLMEDPPCGPNPAG